MQTYWTMVISLGLVVMFGFGIIVLGSKLEKLANEDAPSFDTGVGPVMSRRATTLTLVVSRRAMQTALGVAWFLDGIFQLKPEMFSPAFLNQVILPTSHGQPVWMASLVTFGAHVVSRHLVIWNALFALVQLALGVAMMFNLKLRQTIVASLFWTVIVWVFGEGTGQLLTGQTLLLNGAPGAVLIYGLVAIAIFPGRGVDTREWQVGAVRFAQVSLALLLLLGVVLHLQPAYLTSNGLGKAIAVSWLADAVSPHGLMLSLVSGGIELILAAMLFFKVRVRLAVWVSILLFATYWWAGQMFGQIFDPLATDFNSGLLMVLLAVSCHPVLIGHEKKVR